MCECSHSGALQRRHRTIPMAKVMPSAQVRKYLLFQTLWPILPTSKVWFICMHITWWLQHPAITCAHVNNPSQTKVELAFHVRHNGGSSCVWITKCATIKNSKPVATHPTLLQCTTFSLWREGRIPAGSSIMEPELLLSPFLLLPITQCFFCN